MIFLNLRAGNSGPTFQGVNQNDTLLWDTTEKKFFVGPGGGGGAVASVFGRIGAVVAVTGDYAASEITNDSATVAGAEVSDALDTLQAEIAAITSPVASVFGRIGAVVAVTGDYAASKITNDSATVAGAEVSDALDALQAEIAAIPVSLKTFNQTLAGAGNFVPAGGATAWGFFRFEGTGGGAGGGSGRSSANLAVKGGGSGGGGGAWTRVEGPASLLANSNAYSVGAAGTGGPGVTTTTNGITGSAGGDTTVIGAGGVQIFHAGGGQGGTGAGTGSTSGGIGGTGQVAGVTGGGGAAVANSLNATWPGIPSTAGAVTYNSACSGGAGGAGGGCNASNTEFLATAGSSSSTAAAVTPGGAAGSPSGGAGPGGAGGNGAATVANLCQGGGGGGGGGASVAGTGGAGGTGGFPGGGGGGGGAGLTGSGGSGAGGNGSLGTLQVTLWR